MHLDTTRRYSQPLQLLQSPLLSQVVTTPTLYSGEPEQLLARDQQKKPRNEKRTHTERAARDQALSIRTSHGKPVH